jgi:biotin operon repressor
VFGADPLPPPLRGPARRVLARIVEALDGYWRLAFAPHWPRMRTLLEGDVTYRGRILARQGLGAMFADLSKSVRFTGDAVEVRLRTGLAWTRTVTDGLTLVPTTWTIANALTPITPDEPPMIMYATRGLATLWEPQSLPASGALTELLGATRAGLLTDLATPASSTELAARLGVTVAAVNQHLRALHASGLLVRARHGRFILYRRSDLGDQLAARTAVSSAAPGSR